MLSRSADRVDSLLAVLAFSFLVETAQYLRLYDAHYDPLDHLAYPSLVVPFWAIAKLGWRYHHLGIPHTSPRRRGAVPGTAWGASLWFRNQSVRHRVDALQAQLRYSRCRPERAARRVRRRRPGGGARGPGDLDRAELSFPRRAGSFHFRRWSPRGTARVQRPRADGDSKEAGRPPEQEKHGR